MDSFEFNKIAGAVLGTLLAVMAIGILGEFLFHAEQPEQPGWAVAVSEDGGEGGEAAGEEATPLPVLLASADADAGAGVAKKCLSCHSFEAGGANKVGPALYNVVGRQIAAADGFSYSGAFQEKAAEGFDWTYEHLDGFLKNPRGYIDGTAMAFAGVKDEQDRADLIAYLRSETENPPALPEPEAAPAEAEAPAEGEAQDGQAAEGGAEQPTIEGEHQDAGQPTEPEPKEQAAEQAQPAEGEAQAEQPAAEQAEAEQAQPAEQQQAQADQAQPAANEQAASGGGSGLAAQVAAADVAEGQSQAKKCQACHSFEKGGPNRVGPTVYGVVGRQVAGVEGYSYSDALKEIGGEWTLEKLDEFLANPRGYAKGTKMAFAGVKDEADRHALLHYLHTLQDDPQPLQ